MSVHLQKGVAGWAADQRKWGGKMPPRRLKEDIN
jgi:hypothetical protein